MINKSNAMKRIIKEWITTIFGIILMALSIWDFTQDKEFGYNVGMMLFGVVLLYFKDSWAKEIKDFLLSYFKKS